MRNGEVMRKYKRNIGTIGGIWTEKGRSSMCVVRNFSQLEEALRQDAREVLVIGQLADHFRHLATTANGDAPDALAQTFWRRIQQDYAVIFRKQSHCVPVVLCQHAEKPLNPVCGGRCEC